MRACGLSWHEGIVLKIVVLNRFHEIDHQIYNVMKGFQSCLHFVNLVNFESKKTSLQFFHALSRGIKIMLIKVRLMGANFV